MFKKMRYGMAVLGLPLFFAAIAANANQANCSMTAGGKRNLSATTCDLAFTGTIPTYTCGATFPQTGVYTIKNNTPVRMVINYVRLKKNDGQPTSDLTITGNTCSPSVAAGASCTVTVSLNTAGPFNRILQVGIDSRQVELDSPVITPTVGCSVPSGAPGGTFPCALGTTSTYGTLAGTTITNIGSTVINGDLGLYPGTSVTGFPPGTVNGTQNIANGAALTAQNDLTTLYTCLANRACGTTIGTADQAGTTRISTGVGAINVYCSSSSILNSGVITLDANGDSTAIFIFQAGSTLTMGPGSSIALINGALARNVFFQVGSSATLNSTTVFRGTIAAFSSITLNTGATILGRALARNAAVTFDTNTVNLP